MDSIPVIYDAGVFRPLEPVNLAEGTRAEVIPLTTEAAAPQQTSVWPPAYFDQTAGAFEGQQFDRPELREAIEDRVDLALAKKALKEKGRIPWTQAKKSLRL